MYLCSVNIKTNKSYKVKTNQNGSHISILKTLQNSWNNFNNETKDLPVNLTIPLDDNIFFAYQSRVNFFTQSAYYLRRALFLQIFFLNFKEFIYVFWQTCYSLLFQCSFSFLKNKKRVAQNLIWIIPQLLYAP